MRRSAPSSAQRLQPRGVRRGSLWVALAMFMFLTPSRGAADEQNSGLVVAGIPWQGESADALAEHIEGQPLSLTAYGETQRRTWSSLGASVNRPRLRQLLEAVEAEEGTEEERRIDAPVQLDPGQTLAWLSALKRDHDRPATSARINVETGEVVPEQEGQRLDVWASLESIRVALRAGQSASLVVLATGAHRSAGDLGDLHVTSLLGEFDTPYNGSGEAAERTHNLRVAAAKIDGVLLMPGEEFDFNDVVGERSLANGFRPATVIAGGELVDGVGGGACQIAGTLHAAAFFAGLEILERHPHSRPSTYIKLGLDAAVSYPNINFRMRNNRETPVLIRLSVQAGLTSARVLGDERFTRVQFIRRIDAFHAFAEREVEDDSLPTGIRVLTQRGVPGFSVSRFRIVEDVRTRHMVREASEDSYPPTTQVWHVGTGGAAPDGFETPTGDRHREYTADSFTIMTQGAGVEGTRTVRRAGRTGSLGWTAREMPDVAAP